MSVDPHRQSWSACKCTMLVVTWPVAASFLWRVPRGVEATPTIGLLAAISHARSLADTPIYRQKYGQGEPPQKTIEGVVHLQPRLHAPVDSLPTLIVIVTFPVTYLKVVLPRLPPLQSTVVAPQTKHVQDVQRVRVGSEALPFVVPLPDCPRVQAAFCAGPPSLYQVWP